MHDGKVARAGLAKTRFGRLAWCVGAWGVLALVVLSLMACGGRRRGNRDVIDDGALDGSGDAVDTQPGEDTFGPLPDGVECWDGATRCLPDNSAVELCTAGTWVAGDACPLGCANDQCIVDTGSGACASATSLTLGQTVRGNTAQAPAGTQLWADACTSKYGHSPSGPELAYVLTVDTLGAYEIQVTPVDPTYFGVYIRSSCGDAATEMHDVCAGSPSAGGLVKVTALLTPGTWTVFVDDFGASGNGPGEFDLTVRSVGTPACSGHVAELLDLSSGSVTVSGDTSTSTNAARWQSFDCPAAIDTTGPELLYAFTLPSPARVRLTATALDPADSKMGLYVRSDCEDRYAQVGCGYADGSGTNAIVAADLPTGTYYVFVDDFATSTDSPQTFQLTVEVL